MEGINQASKKAYIKRSKNKQARKTTSREEPSMQKIKQAKAEKNESRKVEK